MHQIFIMIVRDCLSILVYTAAENSMCQVISGCFYIAPSVNEVVRMLCSSHRVQHNGKVTAGWVLHTNWNIHTAGSKTMLLVLYGDRGNIQCLMKRCQWRGIEAETIPFELDDKIDFSGLDIVLLGGGSDREQMLVCEKLKEIQKDFKEYVEDNGVVIAICGGYQLLGNYYKTDQGTIKGLELVDMYTEQGEGRLIQNIVLKSDLFEMPVVGFENHGGRTCINNNKPLGKVLYGAGNDGKSGYEGVVYKNVIGTYLHGPLLPKNPQLADWLINRALERKYGEKVELKPLDDSQEKEANEYVYHRFVRG